MRLPVLVPALLAAFFSLAKAQDSLTAEAAVQRALSNSYSLQQADEVRQAALARVRQAEAGYYPVIAVAADYTRISPVQELSFPGFGSFVLSPADNYDAHVSLLQTVYDFGRRRAGVEVSESGVKSSADALRALRTAITVQTLRAFYAVILLQRSVQVQDQQIQALDEHLRITQRRLESGSATDFDALSTTVRVAQAQSQKVDLQRSVTDQQVTLRRLLGLPWDAPVNPSGLLEEQPVRESVDSLVAKAAARRPDLVSAADQLETARLQVQVAGLGDVPALRVHAAYGLRNGFEPNLNAIRGNWSAGVTVDVPVFNGFQTSSRREEAEAQLRAADQHWRDLRRMAEAEIRQAYAAVLSAHDKIEVTNLQLTQAERAVQNARVRYQSGAGTNLDVLDAETNVAASRLQQLQALYQLVLDRIQLSAAAGEYGK